MSASLPPSVWPNLWTDFCETRHEHRFWPNLKHGVKIFKIVILMAKNIYIKKIQIVHTKAVLKKHGEVVKGTGLPIGNSRFEPSTGALIFFPLPPPPPIFLPPFLLSSPFFFPTFLLPPFLSSFSSSPPSPPFFFLLSFLFPPFFLLSLLFPLLPLNFFSSYPLFFPSFSFKSITLYILVHKYVCLGIMAKPLDQKGQKLTCGL